MPNYTYKCRKCGEEFDVFQSITADAFTNHQQQPETKTDCDGEIYRKIFGTGVVLKGTGFYETDYVKKTGTPAKTES